ncbi:MAG: hypothetical protein EP330_28485 [Deltaproteobacteria bacterium]|nr:MAG: hypothetical protein EP330_28485 [Deltaproteobacteria bacterium]
MRRLFVLLALALAMPAVAGPSVSKSILKDVPPESLAAATALEDQVAALREQLAEAEADAEEAKNGIKAEKLEAKAAEARLEADLAAKKAAKKDGDRAAVRDARATADETRADIEMQEAEAKAARAEKALAGERVKLLKAEIALRSSEAERAKADAAYQAGLPVDVGIFDAAVAKADIDYQKAREEYSLAEAKYNAKSSGMPEE